MLLILSLWFFLFPSLLGHTLDDYKRYVGLSNDIFHHGFDFLRSYQLAPLYTEEANKFHPKFCLAKSATSKFLVVQGTATVYDAVIDMTFIPFYDENLKSYFHAGFYEQASYIFEKIKPLLIGDTGPLICIGHSRGASVSLIVSVFVRHYLRQSLGSVKAVENNVFTVGYAPAPCMSEEGVPKEYQSQYTIFVHNHDIVPVLNAAVLRKYGVPIFDAACLFREKVPELKEICMAWDIVKPELEKHDPLGHIKGLFANQFYWLRYRCPKDFCPSPSDYEMITDFTKAPATYDEINSEEEALARIFTIPQTFQDHLQDNYCSFIYNLTIPG
jgi:hypothetical protein